MNDEREPEDMTVPEYWARKYLAAGNPGDPEVVCNWFHAAMLHAAAAPHMLTESPREAYVRGWKEGFSRHGTAVELNPGVDITRAVHDAQPPTP